MTDRAAPDYLEPMVAAIELVWRAARTGAATASILTMAAQAAAKIAIADGSMTESEARDLFDRLETAHGAIDLSRASLATLPPAGTA